MRTFDEDTIVQLCRKGTGTAGPAQVAYGPGEDIIRPGENPAAMYALTSGMVQVIPGKKGGKQLFRGHFDADPGNIMVIGARHFFTNRPSSYCYRAASEVRIAVFDSEFFAWLTNRADPAEILPVAKALILESDVTDVILPIIARKLGFDIDQDPALARIVEASRYLRDRVPEEALNEQALRQFNHLGKRRARITNSESLVHAPSRLPSGKPRARKRPRTVPPPPPGSPGRAAWESSRSD